ncbi:MAG TPA: MFS transporter, partial [Micromonosporaceae bacterium]|nr:MFS transporter [Micromonosporaceae bacterium]
ATGSSAETVPGSDVAVTSRWSRWGLLNQVNFRRLFVADVTSQMGTQISGIALALVAAVTLRATPFEMGVIAAADTVPFLFASLPAGALADRVRRRPVMIACDVGRLLAVASVPIAWWTHTLAIWLLVVVAFVIGTLSAIFDVAYQSLLPQLVRPDELVEANAKLQGVNAVSQIGGPAAAGQLIRAVSAPVAVGFDAISYFVSAILLGSIRHHEPKPERSQDAHLGRDIAEGVRFVLREPLLRAIAATAGVSNLFNAITNALLFFLLARVLNVSAGSIGLLVTVATIGGLVGALTATKIAAKVGQGRTIWMSMAFSGFFMLGIPMLTRANMWYMAAAFTVAVGGGVVFNVAQISFRQQLAPPHLLGRVNATMRFLILGIMPVGGILGGALATWIGVRPTLWVAAVGSVLSFLPAYLSPLRNMRELPKHDPDGDTTGAHGQA